VQSNAVYQIPKMKNLEIKTHCFVCKKHLALLLILLTGIVLVMIFFIPAATVSFQHETQVWQDSFLYPTKPVIVDGKIIRVAIADSETEVVQGLSSRNQLQNDEGLIFLFTDSTERTFWMKDMKFNIDMIFIDKGIIVDIAKNMPVPKIMQWPATYTSKSPADAVLEVNAGLSDRYGWEVGDTITAPK
jgi:uncharacterized protein